jgi:hypothetical protein
MIFDAVRVTDMKSMEINKWKSQRPLLQLSKRLPTTATHGALLQVAENDPSLRIARHVKGHRDM